jgi:hypothetical protein
MNKGGQVIFYTLMLAVVIVILALAIAPVLKSHNEQVMSEDNLNCSSSLISDYQKAQCKLVDWSFPYFFFGLLAIAGIVLGAKILISD